jgi:hypothetical protein
MKRFTDAGRKAIKEDNLYCALSLALMIPDICGSLENPGPGRSKQRYLAWYGKWALPKFSVGGNAFITADDCFQLRCSLIHSGSAEIEPGTGAVLDRFVFCDKTVGAHLNRFQSTVINGVDHGNFLQIKVDRFSESMYEAADEWDRSISGNQKIQAEKAKLLVIQTKGFSIGGAIKFG